MSTTFQNEKNKGKCLPLYTRKEVRQHNTTKDLWVILDNKVYDITRIQEYHPGGTAKIEEKAGRDATHFYFKVIQHSAIAEEIRKHYLIGELVGRDKRKYKFLKSEPEPEKIENPDMSESFLLTIFLLGSYLTYGIYRSFFK